VYYEFPEDKLLPFTVEEAIAKVPIGPRSIADHIVDIAACFNIRPSNIMCEWLLRLWIVLIRADDAVDEAPRDRRGDAAKLCIRLITGEVPYDRKLPRWVVPRDLARVIAILRTAFAGTSQLGRMPVLAEEILTLSRAKSETTNVITYIRTVVAENTKVAEWAMLCMSDEEATDPAYVELWRWGTIFIVKLALHDALVDLYDDHRKGTILVRTTRLNESILWLAWRLYSLRALRNPRVALAARKSTRVRFYAVTRKPTQTRAQRRASALFHVHIDE